MSLTAKISRLKDRHPGRFWQGLFTELFAALLRNQLLRALITRFWPTKAPKRVVFMAGCYNSGTTILKNAIALHPLIACPPVEGSDISTDLPDFDQDDWPRCMYGNVGRLSFVTSHWRFNKRRFFREMSPWFSERQFLLEKSISNTPVVGLLAESIPEALFITVIRDPSRTIEGIRKKSVPSSRIQRLLGQNAYPESMLRDQWRGMYSYLAAVNPGPGRMLTVSFERFLEDPVGQLLSVYRFLGLSDPGIEYANGSLTVGDNSVAVNARVDAGRSGDKLDSEYRDFLGKLKACSESSYD